MLEQKDIPRQKRKNKSSFYFWFLVFGFAFIFFSKSDFVFADNEIPAEIQKIKIQNKIGQKIDLDTEFFDHEGQKIRLKDVFESDNLPVILIFVYYRCPKMCNVLLGGFTSSIKKFEWKLGERFKVITVSFVEEEKPSLAKQNRSGYLERYGDNENKDWLFLTGDQKNIMALTQSAGFRFEWSEKANLYVHESALFFVSPEGVITSVKKNVRFTPFELKMGLLRASDGEVGEGFFDQLLLSCFHYDPDTGSFRLATNILRWIALFFVFGLALMIFLLSRKKRSA